MREGSLRQRLRDGLGIACLLIALVGILRWEGRSWWCACGGLSPWTSDTHSAHCSQHLLDPYSLTHLLHGVLLCGFFALLLPRISAASTFLATIALEALWEIVENSAFIIERYRTATMALGYEGDSIGNSLGDVAACAFGWALARFLGWNRSIALCVMTELILLFWIRDNLSLNVIMLLFPIEAIRTWQMGV